MKKKINILIEAYYKKYNKIEWIIIIIIFFFFIHYFSSNYIKF